MRKKSRKQSFVKEKITSTFSVLSGGLSFLGGWQICHNVCLGIIAALSLIGITIVGMPLLFLTKYAVYFWSVAVLLLIPTLVMYWKNRTYMSAKIILLNVGIIVAAIPFNSLRSYQLLFWMSGGTLIGISIILFLRKKFKL